MRRLYHISSVAATAVLLFGLAHSLAMGSDRAGGYRFVLVSEIASDAERIRILSQGADRRAKSVQSELSTDPAFLAAIRSRGLSLRNVIGRQRAGNGRIIVYVR